MNVDAVKTVSAHRLTTFAVIALGTLAHRQAAPFESNQNQYFAHALDDPRLAGDWLVGTPDPYPAFTRLASTLLRTWGTHGTVAVSAAATAIGLIALWRIARTLVDAASANAAVAICAVMFWQPSTQLPGVGWLHGTSAFTGLAAQETLSKVGYLQPSTAGVLVLAAVSLVVTPSPAARHVASAAILVTAACIIHPTYLSVVAVLAAGALLANPNLLRPRVIAPAVAGMLGLTAASIGANPPLLAMRASGADAAAAQTRFAFERIPHHTLVTQWPGGDVWLVAAVIAAALLLHGYAGRTRLGRWLVASLVIGLVGAIIVAQTRSAPLALLFPWRASVVLVPIAWTVLAAFAGQVLSRRPSAVVTLGLMLTSVAAVGAAFTVRDTPPSVAEASARAVIAAQPQGVGVVPLGAWSVRLNARVPIYVDYKSPPYAGESLVEWWARVDRVAGTAAEPSAVCDEAWANGISWVLLSPRQELSGCLAEWTQLAEDGGWRVLQRP